MPTRSSAPSTSSSNELMALLAAEAAHDVRGVVSVLSTHLWALLDEDPDTVYRCFNVIDPATLAADPMLATVRALCTVMAAPYALAPSAPQSLRAAGASTDPATVAFSHMLAARFRGAFAASREAADAIRERVLEQVATPYRIDSVGAPLYLLHVGITTMLGGDLAQAMSDFNGAGQLAKMQRATLIQRDALAKVAVLHGLNGRLSLADASLARLGSFEHDLTLRQYTHDSPRLAQALDAVDRLDPNARELVDSLDLLDPVNELWPVVLLLRGRLALAEGTPARVFDEISIALDCHPHPEEGLAADVIRSLRMHAFTAMREYASALALADEGMAAGGLGVFSRVAWMEVTASCGRIDEARREARRSLSSMTDSAAVRDQALLVAAHASYDADGTVDATTALGVRALTVLEGKRRVLVWLPEPVVTAIGKALPAAMQAEFAQATTGVPLSAAHVRGPELSPAESRVLRTIRDVGTVAATAARLYVSENTVKTRLSSIYRKLGVHDRADALRQATRHGLLDSASSESGRSGKTASVSA